MGLYRCLPIAITRKYQKNSNLIINKLNISKKLLQQALQELEKMGLIQIKHQGIVYLDRTIHLKEEDILSKSHHTNWRLKALENINNQNTGWHFTVGLTINKKNQEIVHSKFKNLIYEIYLLSQKSKNNDDLIHICIDLF